MIRILGIALMVGGTLLAQAPVAPLMGFSAGAEMDLTHGTTVADAPFSAVWSTTRDPAPDAPGATEVQTKVFRDSQGRVREEMTWKGEYVRGAGSVTIFDPVAKVVRSLDSQRKTYAETAMLPPMPRDADGKLLTWGGRAPRIPAGDVRREDLGTQTIGGVEAIGTRFIYTAAPGAPVNAQSTLTMRETWVSSDPKLPVMTKFVDSRAGTTVTQLTEINRSEPDAALFQVPADYALSEGRATGVPAGLPR